MLIIIQSIDNTMEKKRGIHVSIPPYRDNCGRLGEWCVAQYHCQLCQVLRVVRGYHVNLGALLLLQCIAYTMEKRPLKFCGIQGTIQGNRNNCRWPLGDIVCAQYCSVPSSLVIRRQVQVQRGHDVPLCRCNTSWGGIVSSLLYIALHRY